MIACASPFCEKIFHLVCAGVKSKAKDVSKLYFVCLSCEEFISYSNSKIENKLTDIEIDLNKNIQAIKNNIVALEESTLSLKQRLHSLENSLTDNKEKCNEIVKNNTSISAQIQEIDNNCKKCLSEFKSDLTRLKEQLSKESSNNSTTLDEDRTHNK